MGNKNNKLIKITKGAIFAITILLAVNIVSAASWECFTKGERINFCNPKTPDRTCGSTICLYCISNYNEANDCYNQGNFNACNGVSQDCSGAGGHGEIDSQPPILTILNPIQDEIYQDRAILLNILTDEKSDISFTDNMNSRGRWTRLCQDCMSYQRTRSFNESSINWRKSCSCSFNIRIITNTSKKSNISLHFRS